MAYTYIQVVNEILADSNEVELTSANFSSAVGVQKIAKNAVNRAYLEICAKEVEWPFLRAGESNVNDPYDGTVSVETVVGTRWYLLKSGSTSINTDYAKIDWDSFYLTNEGVSDEVAPYEQTNLKFITYQDWVDKYRDGELRDASESEGYQEPSRVIKSKDGRYFGLSPIPDDEYKIYFTAWNRASKLSANDDTILVPDDYVHTLYSRGSYLNKFKGDHTAAQMDNAAFEKQLREMRRALMGQQEAYMRDDRVSR